MASAFGQAPASAATVSDKYGERTHGEIGQHFLVIAGYSVGTNYAGSAFGKAGTWVCLSLVNYNNDAMRVQGQDVYYDGPRYMSLMKRVA